VGSALLAFGAILTAVSGPAGVAVALLGFVWEAFLFFRAGR
jgi:hypothetical protein